MEKGERRKTFETVGVMLRDSGYIVEKKLHGCHLIAKQTKCKDIKIWNKIQIRIMLQSLGKTQKQKKRRRPVDYLRKSMEQVIQEEVQA